MREPTPEQVAIYTFARMLREDKDARRAWIDAIEELLPPHTHQDYEFTYAWSTPVGLWKLVIDVRDIGRGVAELRLTGPGIEWAPYDYRLGHVEQFLRLVGAIE